MWDPTIVEGGEAEARLSRSKDISLACLRPPQMCVLGGGGGGSLISTAICNTFAMGSDDESAKVAEGASELL
jgi:hypothetical protein